MIRALAVAVAGVLTVTVLSFVPVMWGVGLLGVLVWFALPGVAVARRLYCDDPPSAGGWIAALLIGPVWGYVVSSLVLLGLWSAGLRNGWLLLAPAPAMLVAVGAKRLCGSLAPPIFTKRDVAAILFVLLAVLAIVARPYSRVGVDLPDGRAYRAYFTADFVWAMAVVAEVSKGDVPPRNPYYLDDALHYYWLMHLLPAAEHRLLGSRVSIEQLLLVNALGAGLMFGAFLYFFARHFVLRPWAAALGGMFVLFCSSFEGIERLWWAGATLDQLRSVNIDGVGNWFYQGMKIDGLQRALFWQPQHMVGYMLGYSALLLLVEARDHSRVGVLFAVGTLLGLAMLLSSPAAAILTAAVAAYETYQLIAARQWRAFIPCAVAGALPMVAALALSSLLQYVDTEAPGNPLVTFGVNRLATHRVWMTIFLNFGPAVILALLGLVAALWRRSLRTFLPVLLAIGISAVFYVLVDVPDHQGVYVAWRASHLIFISLTALCGYAVQEWWGAGGWRRWTIVATTVAVGAAALPTVLIDIYNAQDVENRADGPGFKWTVVLTPPELQALDWLKRETPVAARVQNEPYSRNRDAYYITAFGERRMSGGLPTGLIPMAKYEAVSGRIKGVYTATSARAAHDAALDLCIDYLMIGPPERHAYPQLQPLLDASPHLFAPVFNNDTLAIYAISGSWELAGCKH
jgi:hypothetical protein